MELVRVSVRHSFNPAQIQAQTIIVIHPGSLFIRVGRASDLNPHTVLHAVARRRLPGGAAYQDYFLPKQVSLSKEILHEMEECRLQISHTLQSCLQSDGRRRYATPPQQIAAFNRQSSAEELPNSEPPVWTVPDTDVVVGDEVMHINPNLDYNIHFPYRRGDLNIHAGPGGSMSGVLADLETIWSWIIKNRLDIPLKDLRHYRAVLVIPDIYNRQHLKELTTLLLCKIGFGGCFLLQDHVAATFGAGLGYACVVDVGDQKSSVSCVEDGISHKNTRVRMDYGGGDITQAFLWLLQKCAFPYRTCNPDSKLDAMLLRQLKENFCHVNLDICGSQEKSFVLKQPNRPTRKYTLQVGDECIVAPLSLFQPELLAVTGPKQVHIQKRSTGDPEDPHDDNYLRETSRRGAKEALEPLSGGFAGSELDGMNAGLDCSGVGGQTGEEDIVVDAMDATVPTTVRDADTKEFVVGPEQVLGLDQAILQSIDRCPTDDLKRKMYGCILIVGGGMKFPGIGTWLQNRICLQIPYMYRAEQLDIITNPKEMDPQITTWKGAAIMSCLESAQELWLYPNEWQKIGVKLLRERAPFMW
ncbi:actin-related protein 8 isoform X1 [Schistocerca piceifrons]|uniref:actin-related protein 8 isoform X1 n=1 Tax=Schistocerca piceifrons TaxID=274613 RepID=UPI001F5E71DA|nr:actin-related protein 8 isoform X1 [Schistocerca piceifrons]